MSGCKPFLASANRLLEKKRGSISDSYVVEARRKYQMLDQRLMDMKEAGSPASGISPSCSVLGPVSSSMSADCNS